MTIKIEQAYFAARERLATLDWETTAIRLGVAATNQALEIPFFGQPHRIGLKGCYDGEGRSTTMAVGLVLYRYILDFPDVLPPTDQRVSFRETEGSGPLVTSFANNTHKILAGHFAHIPDELCNAAQKLAGNIHRQMDGYDLLITFDALPGAPLYLQYNAADEDFPAYAGLLFHRSTELNLGLQVLFILGTYLTGRLIQTDKS